MFRLFLFLLCFSIRESAFAAESLPISTPMQAALDARYPENPTDLRLIEAQVEKVATQAVAATVELEVDQSIGSGVIISPKGLILTAAHVIGGAGREVTVILADGRRLKGHTLGAHHRIDAGMVQLDEVPHDLPFAPVTTSDEVNVSSWVVATGQPGGVLDDRSPPVRLGRILAKGGQWICTDCTLVGGDSGGPLFNMHGEVTAIHMSIGMAAAHNFHVPVAAIRPYWEKMLAGTIWGQSLVDDDSSEERVTLGIAGREDNDRCLVTQIFHNFPAERSGMNVGDVIEAVDGEPIESLAELGKIIADKEPGKRIRIRVLRGQRSLDLAVRLQVLDSPLPGSLDLSIPDEVVSEESDEPKYNYPDERITVPSWRFAHGPHVRAAFRDGVGDVRKAVVEIHIESQKVGLGGIVDPQGFILTKASILNGPITCVTSDGLELPVSLVATSRAYDLALLKVTARDLPALKISATTAPIVGSWLASVGMDNYPIAVGVVSVEPREIPHQAGILGVQLDNETNTARIVRIFPASAAAKAGMLVNDVVLEIEGEKTPTRESLIKRVQEFSPGDSVKLAVKRGDEQLELSVVLMGRFPGLRPSRNEFQNRLGGELNERRFGFASAFQHDTVLEPTDAGGPAINLKGEVVGFNIARSGRTETYGVAADSIHKVIEELMPKEPAKP